jgi:DNA-binding SARP family transcriptional activator
VNHAPYTHGDLIYIARLLNWFSQQVLLVDKPVPAGLPPAGRVPEPPANDLPACTAPLAIYALRAMEVTHRGVRVPQEAWGSEKGKGMLAYLLWKGSEGATRDEISAALWPDRDESDARNVFHVTLHRLRRVLEPERQRGSSHVLFEHGRYRLQKNDALWLDVDAFEALACAPDAPKLARGVALYRAGYLEDVAWALPAEAEIERRRLEVLYEHALLRLTRLLPPKARENYLLRLIQQVPGDEEANEMLLSDYLMIGRNDLAKKHLDSLREQFDDSN